MRQNCQLVKVQLVTAIENPLTYNYPHHLGDPEIGSCVKVPLGSRYELGVIWEQEKPDSKVNFKLKDIAQLYPLPALPHSFINWLKWLAEYTITPISGVLAMALRDQWVVQPTVKQKNYRWNGVFPSPMTKGRKVVCDALIAAKNNTLSRDELLSYSGVSSSILVKMLESKIISEEIYIHSLDSINIDTTTQDSVSRSFCDIDIKKNIYDGAVTAFETDEETVALNGANLLSSEQKLASSEIITSISKAKFSPYLLDGVTGSGKTEVYFDVVEKILQSGGQCLILLPEIILTSEFLNRFCQTFGFMPEVWHAKISNKRKGIIWRGALRGDVRVVVGARSALFLPFSNLKLIVVDEEHDSSYKQDDGVNYNARDMAVARAKQENAIIILASATPSLETLRNVELQRYGMVKLVARYGEAEIPAVELIDIRKDPPERNRWIGGRLLDELQACLNKGKQAMLFLNRRGYAPLVICRSCGSRLTCHACDTWLSEHRSGSSSLMCHLCASEIAKPETCPHCKSIDSLSAIGPGVERLHEEISSLFPTARSLVMSSDTMTSTKTMENSIDQIRSGAVDIIIGTQVIAKGHNFPNLTLVGIVDGDYAMSHMDLRASERCFQLMTQVVGRAGRGADFGKALIQTSDPDNPIIKTIANFDRDTFVETEMNNRKQAALPPFGRLIALIISHEDIDFAEQFTREVAAVAPTENAVVLLGPVPATISRIKYKFRWRFLVQSNSGKLLQPYMRKWLSLMPKPRRGVRIKVDVDPVSFY